LALYLFLVTVADARGLSFWGDDSIRRELGLRPATLTQARAELMAAGLIAWEAPLYQVLALGPAPASGEKQPLPTPADTRPRQGVPNSIRDYLRRALEAQT
jgi:phage gp46-like protein